jgi:hypothetical protein
MGMTPWSASLLSSGATEPLLLLATHTLLPLSGMCKEKSLVLALSGRQEELLICLAGLLLRSALLT